MTVINIRLDGTEIDDISKVEIPTDHQIYTVLKSFVREANDGKSN